MSDEVKKTSRSLSPCMYFGGNTVGCAILLFLLTVGVGNVAKYTYKIMALSEKQIYSLLDKLYKRGEV